MLPIWSRLQENNPFTIITTLPYQLLFTWSIERSCEALEGQSGCHRTANCLLLIANCKSVRRNLPEAMSSTRPSSVVIASVLLADELPDIRKCHQTGVSWAKLQPHYRRGRRPAMPPHSHLIEVSLSGWFAWGCDAYPTSTWPPIHSHSGVSTLVSTSFL